MPPIFLTVGEALDRLAGLNLPRPARAALKGAPLGRTDPALWVAKPSRVTCPSPGPALVVVSGTVTTTRAVVLRTRDIFGFDAARDGIVYVFLGPVRARDVCVVPDTLAIFAGGLRADRVACFDAPDAHTFVAKSLAAPYVVSRTSGGGVDVESGAKVRIGACAGKVAGLPRDVKPKKHASLGAMLPFLGDDEREDPWERVVDFAASGRAFPKTNAAMAKKKTKTSDVRGKTFFFTGRLASRYATMKDAQRIVEIQGGTLATKVSKDVDFLVVGDNRSPLLGQGPKSKPLLEAEALNARGAQIVIVREDVFWDMKKT
ncbi:BRCT domain-containing protein [Myxococcus xanthus]|uniref:BRCT domain-containing protein n=1 Tax=Myxococcus xanthus TaxID=34 RepID=A0A7Y4IKS1_MYXXA|nr:BRCT domain-containing protein [Myxococcus xanthus]NOJ80395.1 hypothetical protein [Myxococcus xanthus]NOJ84928.1 hypothetical protein [Myxococcus xanthus]